MSSAAAKARTRKKTNIACEEKDLLSSRNENEATEDNLKELGSSRRYNLRSYSPLKTATQLRSKTGKSNIDSKHSMNNNIKKNKAKEKIGLVHSKKVNFPKNCANIQYLSPKNQNKIHKNGNKHWSPKFFPTAVNEIRNLPDENSQCIPNSATPFKSILKNVASPIKNSFVINVNEKDVIKERIYGASSIKPKKVTFKTMSCDNLRVFSNKNMGSNEIEEEINVFNELDDFDSTVEDASDENKVFRERISENKNGDILLPYTILENLEEELNENSFQLEKANFISGDNTPPSYVHKCHNFQVKKNKFSKLDKSPISERLCQISPNEFEVDYSNDSGNILNKQESSDENILDIIQNDILPKIENFSIFSDIKIPETVAKSETFKGKTEEKDENLCIESEDQNTCFRFIEEENLLEKDSSYDNDPNVNENTSKNRCSTNLLSFLGKHAVSIREGEFEHMNFQNMPDNNNQEKVNVSDAKKDGKKKRKTKRNKLSAKCFLGSRKVKIDDYNIAQTKFAENDSYNQTPNKQENNFQTHFWKNLNDDEFKTPQKECFFDTKTHADFDLHRYKSPRVSRIPRIFQSPVSKFVVNTKQTVTPICIKLKPKENELDGSCSLEYEVKKIERKTESFRNESNETDDVVHKNILNIKSDFDDAVVANESITTNSNECIQTDCCESNEAASEGKALLQSYHKATSNIPNDSEFNLNENFNSNDRNVVYDSKANENSEIIKKCNPKIDVNSENLSSNIDEEERIKTFALKKKSDTTNETKLRQERNLKSKTLKKSRRNYFWLFFVINTILLILLFKLLEDPFIKIKFS